MRKLSNVFLALAGSIFFSGSAMGGCPSPGCPVVTGDPAPAVCSSEVCNTHLFFTDGEGRLMDIERNLVDYGWPCPGRCPVWDSSTRTYVRQFTDYGWKLNQVSGDAECSNFTGRPAYFADDEYRMLASVTEQRHLVLWTSPASCCRQCAADAASACTCTLEPAENECDPPVCNCECPDPGECEPWSIEESVFSPSCSCNDQPDTASCCWNSIDLTEITGVPVVGNPSMCGRNIFARSDYNHLIQFWLNDSGWNRVDLTNQITGKNISIVEDPSCFRDDSGVQYVVFRSGSGHLTVLMWNGNWQWFDLTMLAGGQTVQGRPVVIYDNDSATGHIFAKGPDSQLFEWWWNNDGLQFVNVTATCNSSIAGNPSVCSCNGAISVVFRDNEDHLIRVVRSCQDQASWMCEDLTEVGCGKTIAGDPACMSIDGEESVFARTDSGRLLRWVNNGRGWQVTDMLMDIGCPNDIGMFFSFIPAGTFNMGSPASEYGRDYDEGPVHQVSLTNPYYMQTTEVTQSQFNSVMGFDPSANTGCANCPVENVTWSIAKRFVDAMNARCEGVYSLPTEAEWEYAARAGNNAAWYFGDNLFDLPEYAWYLDNAWDMSHPVAQKLPNLWGLYDIYGNVAEWVADAYSSYTTEIQVNPFAIDNNWINIIRGGSWNDPDTMQRSASRHYNIYPEAMQPYIGIRLKRNSVGR